MEFITIGRVSFKAETLRSLSKKECQDAFKNIDKQIVSKAWSEANPKGRKKTSKK
jgi:hypothetical protein